MTKAHKIIETNDLLADNPNLEAIAEMELKNLRISKIKFPDDFKGLEELLILYKSFIKSFVKPPNQNKVPILQMYFITLRGFIISTQLMLQGHFSEAFTIISRASEATGYAVVMNNDIEKIKAWINKEDNKEFKKLFGKPFPKGNKLLHPSVFTIYNLTREYGSHANFVSTIHFTSKISHNKAEFIYCDFNDFDWMKRYLVFTIHSYFEFLVVFKKLFNANLNKDWCLKFDAFFKKWCYYRDNHKNLFSNKGFNEQQILKNEG